MDDDEDDEDEDVDEEDEDDLRNVFVNFSKSSLHATISSSESNGMSP